MMGDMGTVMWKEWKELLAAQGGARGRGGWRSILLILGVFGIFLPWQTGPDWALSPVVLLYWAWVPLFLVSGVIADSFAGERERHTLETLLATRLPDTAILAGKAAVAVAYGWGLATGSLLLGLVTVNVAYSGNGILLYAPSVAFGGLTLGLLTAGLAAGVGVLISLRAATVRQAAQTMSLAVMALLFLPVFGIQALPAGVKASLAASLLQTDRGAVVVAVAAVLVALNVVVFALARLRFRRSRLILD